MRVRTIQERAKEAASLLEQGQRGTEGRRTVTSPVPRPSAQQLRVGPTRVEIERVPRCQRGLTKTGPGSVVGTRWPWAGLRPWEKNSILAGREEGHTRPREEPGSSKGADPTWHQYAGRELGIRKLTQGKSWLYEELEVVLCCFVSIGLRMKVLSGKAIQPNVCSRKTALSALQFRRERWETWEGKGYCENS